MDSFCSNTLLLPDLKKKKNKAYWAIENIELVLFPFPGLKSSFLKLVCARRSVEPIYYLFQLSTNTSLQWLWCSQHLKFDWYPYCKWWCKYLPRVQKWWKETLCATWHKNILKADEVVQSAKNGNKKAKRMENKRWGTLKKAVGFFLFKITWYERKKIPSSLYLFHFPVCSIFLITWNYLRLH